MTLVKIIITILILTTWVEELFAEPLSAVALYHRCYKHMTQEFAPRGDSVENAVKAETLDPIDACMNLLDSAKLISKPNSVYEIADKSNMQAKQVLRTFHYLHYSWFGNKDFRSISGNLRNLGTKDLYDSSTPALYLDHALLTPDTLTSTILTADFNLRPVRSSNNPSTGAATNAAKSSYIFGSNTEFAPRGVILGLRKTNNIPMPYTFDGGGTANLGKHFGGGVLGSPAFLLLSINEEKSFQSDGGLSMARKWSKEIFSTLLCRKLPIVRPEDTIAFVDLSSSIPFRQSQSCASCHVSMDQMAASIRGFKYTSIGETSGTVNRGADFSTFHSVTQGAGTFWPTSPDVNYHKRPQDGKLYYRNHSGMLVNISTSNGPIGLGEELANQEDVYTCLAKRYYKYFTGIDAHVGDLHGVELSTKELAHRNTITTLGQQLKTHQNLRKLVKDIISSSEYALSDYGLGGL